MKHRQILLLLNNFGVFCLLAKLNPDSITKPKFTNNQPNTNVDMPKHFYGFKIKENTPHKMLGVR